MRLYWELARCGYRRTAIYRTAAISGAITNTFFGFLRAYMFIALYEARGEVGGYTLADTLAFTFITQGMAALIGLWGWWPIAESVQDGSVASDLSRPYDYQFAWMAQDYGRALYQFVARSAPPFVVGMVAFGITLPGDPLIWLALVPTVILSVGVSYGWRFCLNLSTFWWTDHRGTAGIAMMIGMLFSGFLVPIAMWPDGLREIGYLSPFAAMVAIPIDVFLGKLSGTDVLAALALQAFWLVALLALGRLVLSAALHKLVVQGG
ncbi:MAG: ABC-2 family transporter protein [Chloroflexi bacterium]|nr:ABC-2 family transporter protein [Chloroflexota bacterium]